MTSPASLDLDAVEAARWIEHELRQANEAVQMAELDAVLDGYARALSLALQLGPAASQKVLTATLETACELARREAVDALSALGPALVDVVTQVTEANALPPTAVMEAWTTVASALGALIGQIGLALAVPPEHRAALLRHARSHAVLLEDATGGLLNLTAWLDQIQAHFGCFSSA